VARLLGGGATLPPFPLISSIIVYWSSDLGNWSSLQVAMYNYICVGGECSVSLKESGALGYKWEENGLKVWGLLGAWRFYTSFL